MKTETKVDTLQLAIEKRAQVRLRADLKQIADMIRANRLTNYPAGRTGLEEKSYPRIKTETQNNPPRPQEVSLAYLIDTYGKENAPGTAYAKALYDWWLPIYIEEETAAFLSKVTTLEELHLKP